MSAVRTIDYAFLQLFGVHGWMPKIMQPFEFIGNIYIKPLCIAVLPISNSRYKRDSLSKQDKYTVIKNLYCKMLSVLELDPRQLLKVVMHENEQQQFSIEETIATKTEQKKLLTKKILSYEPQCILIFGNKDFLDINLLNLENKNILIFKTIHPEYLLTNPQDKRQAYQDLLLCKEKLATLP